MSENELCGRKLAFGDSEQIEELKGIIRKLEEREQLKHFKVSIYFEGSIEFTVEAHDEEEAIEIAKEERFTANDYIDNEDYRTIETSKDSEVDIPYRV